jgi:hypothetical protein
VGYFVEIENGKIQKALNKKPIGIISTTSAFIGDSTQDYWSEIYEKDEWGKAISINYEVYEFEKKDLDKKIDNEKTTIYFDEKNIAYKHLPSINSPAGIIDNSFKKETGKFVKTIEELKINPLYDPNKEYIARKDRKEWDVVGLIGKLRVRTCENITGQYVDVDINTGMAKNGTTYPVLKKFKDYDGNYGIVLIFFK